MNYSLYNMRKKSICPCAYTIKNGQFIRISCAHIIHASGLKGQHLMLKIIYIQYMSIRQIFKPDAQIMDFELCLMH